MLNGFKLSDDMSERISHDLFVSANKPKLHLYVDMCAMYDYKLTALLKLCTVSSEYEYVKRRLSTYAKYKGSDITKVFPVLKFTKEMIDDCLRDPANTEYFSRASLVTNVSNLIPMQLMVFNTNNRQTPLWENQPINIHFVNKYFKLSEEAALRINAGLLAMDPGIICNFYHRDPYSEPEPFLAQIDHFILDDMMSFTVDPESVTYKMLFGTKQFIGATFFASHQLDDEQPWMDEDGEKRLANTEKFLNMFTFFMTFDKLLLTGNNSS